MCGQQQKQRHENEADGDAQKAHQPEVGAHHRAFIIVLRTLGELKNGAGQDQHGGRVVHNDCDVPLCQKAAGHVRTFRQENAGQKMEPFFLYQQLLQTFGTHGQGGDGKGGENLAQLLYQSRIGGMIQIGDCHIRFAFASHRGQLEGESRVADAPPDQVGIEKKRLHKTIPGPLRHLFRVRL